jgi:MOSC domain-containing protein YiiM
MKLRSVNVGQPRMNPGKATKLTGIDKRPVSEEGEIQAGDQMEIVHRPDHDVTMALTFRALTVEPELLPRLLVADALPRDIKELAGRRIA